MPKKGKKKIMPWEGRLSLGGSQGCRPEELSQWSPQEMGSFFMSLEQKFKDDERITAGLRVQSLKALMIRLAA